MSAESSRCGPPTVLLLLGLAATAFLAYIPALRASFIADDYTMLRTIERSTGLLWPFTHNDVGQPASEGHFYRPVWVLANDLVYQAFGASATAFHAFNFVLFALIAVEVWLLARFIAGGRAAWLAAFAFALYPRHGESVAWISGNTDLVAAAFGLGALLCVLSVSAFWVRTLGAAGLAAAAALSKEIAFILPVLALLALLGQRRGVRDAPRALLAPVAAMAIAELVVFLVRTDVLRGIGGYTAFKWTPTRIASVLPSYVLAALSPPQLELLRRPLLLAVPAILLALASWRVWRLLASRDTQALRVVAIGVAWFVASLLPSLNLPIDLNNANGERFLFFPSVGLALALAGLIDLTLSKRQVLVLAAAALLAIVATVENGHRWLVAGRIADRVLRDSFALGPRGGELVLLSVPESYRSARVFHGSFEAAADRAGRGDLSFTLCLPVQAIDAKPSQVTFRRTTDTIYEGRTTWLAPFDFPVLHGSDVLTATPGCSYRRADGKRWPVGVGLVGEALPTTSRARVAFAFFDGYTVRACCPAAP